MTQVKGKIIATKEQLDYIGCSRPLTDLVLEVKDIDRWSGIEAPCSTVVFYPFLNSTTDKFQELFEEFIVPTKWIEIQ